MSLIRWNPNKGLTAFPSEFLNVQKEMNHLFDNLFRSNLSDELESFTGNWMPAVDVAEKDDEYQVKMELPGVNKDDVKITMQDNILTIRGEKKSETETNKSNFHRFERAYGSFQRSFTLPTRVKGDGIDASFKDGVLSIAIPKAEEAKPKQIEVKVK